MEWKDRIGLYSSTTHLFRFRIDNISTMEDWFPLLTATSRATCMRKSEGD